MIIKKSISLFELSLVVLSIFSFAYLVSPNTMPLVSADDEGFKGCCLETKEGAICQTLPFAQKDLCKKNIVGTDCSLVDQCSVGCCYSPNTGTCAMRAPKEQCIANGGNWSNDASCNIPQCQLGCCVLGDQVTLTNSRECTLLSNKFDFDKKFVQVSAGESCEQFTGLEKEGACLMDSGDFSGEKNCKYTTKKNCQSGEFVGGYLCTSEELNTLCMPSKKTSCVEGKDQVYFLDSCGNLANVYDASKVDDQSYWEKPISPENSCSKEGADCGNCNYIQGSVCTEYEAGKTIKPTYGDNVCKNLNCGSRKHGESWCVYDFDPNGGIAPVGSRHFVANCFEGQISIEGCADFMQEVCAQSTDTSFGFTEAKCLVNDWRSCLNANDGDSYSKVKKLCDENPQCVMFNDLYGEDNLKRSDGKFFAGFDPEKTNEEQGSIDDLGKDQNNVLIYCVPKFTPGFQFWNSNSQIVGSGNSKKQSSSASYGGDSDEANAICSLGSFTCVSQTHRSNTLAGSTGSWQDHELNWECNIDGVHESIKGEDLPAILAAMNERCRALGTCGVSTNIAGFVNDEFPGFSIKRVHINKEGKTQDNYDITGYNLSGSYIDSIKKSTSSIKKLSQLASSSGGLSADSVDGVGVGGELYGTEGIDLKTLAGQAKFDSSSSSFVEVMNIAGPLTMAGLMFPGVWGWLKTPVTTTTIPSTPPSMADPGFGPYMGNADVPVGSVGSRVTVSNNFWNGLKSFGITLAATIIGSYLGAQLGKLIAKNQDWSPGKTNQFIEFMGALGGGLGMVGGTALGGALLGSGGATGAAGASSALGTMSGFGAGGIFGTAGFSVVGFLGFAGLVIAVAMVIYSAFFDKFEEQQYYILQFSCDGWQAPKGGNCELCNDDVRPCSEYRCKSLGSNCHYFIENGEPGYCATINEIWSAQIKPWQEILSEGNQYVSVQQNGFKIQDTLGRPVNAWESLIFGITTDKPATCKIDFKHTKSYDEMGYEMFSSLNPDTGKFDGIYHMIELNAYSGGESKTTIGLAQGDKNEYYIRCMNFAGQVNEAEFVVQVEVKDGPDLTPAELRRFEPMSGSYLKKGENTTSVTLYLNEPAECRFDYEYDAVSGEEGYNDLPHEMFCMTDKSSAYYGEWMCMANLENLTADENNLYFRCKDQPDLTEEIGNYRRNVNFVSTNYKLNVCSEGLNISLLNQNTFIEEPNFTLSVSTSGCLGDSVCSFSIKNYSDMWVQFFDTGKKIHSQLLMLPQGNYSIDVLCEDEARNTANETFEFDVYFDNVAPTVTRIFKSDGKIAVFTDEPAECIYRIDTQLGCEFDFESETISYLSENHYMESRPGETYFIKCRDKKLNLLQDCLTVARPV